MKIVFMGTTDFSKIILEKLHKKYPVSLVVTQPDKKVGRKQTIVFSPVKELALDLGIELFQPERIKESYKKIVNLKPDVIITAAYGQIIPIEVINSSICLNVHGSLLPKRRGGAPVQRAIMEGDKTTGVTLMHMVYKMDAGDIIVQEGVKIEDNDTTTTLMDKLAHVGSKLLLDNLLAIIDGSAPRIQQEENAATFSYNLTLEDEIIDFNKPTSLVLRQLNGLLDEPGGAFYLKGERIKVYKLKKSDIIISATPGTVLSVNKELTIKTEDGAVDILEIQSSGKRRMNIKDYLNGQRLFQEGDVIDE
ncbi:MAG: methionyl-tRNA formyltransferase [Acholeplasmataceae bacterium]